MIWIFILLGLLALLGWYGPRGVGDWDLRRDAGELPPRRQLSWRLRPEEICRINPRAITVSAEAGEIPAEAPAAPPAALPESPQFTRMALAGAGLDSLHTGAGALHAAWQIDPAVLGAIEESTAQHIHHLPGVADYVDQHFWHAAPAAAQGWFERLTGYVTEQKAASILEAQGHHVEFAPTPNQPAWDLRVDGHIAQIKESGGGVHAFLEQHHHITVYTSPEAATAAHSALVHGLHGINSDAIHHVTQQSLEGLHTLAHPHFHLPWITAALSSYRELKLLITEKTTMTKAIKNAGLDVLGVGGGVWAGAQMGGWLGVFLGPVGAAVFGALGAIVGGIGGRLMSKEIRFRPFYKARQNYEAARDQAEHGLRDAETKFRRETGRWREDLEAEFQARRNRFMDRLRETVRGWMARTDEETSQLAQALPQHLRDLLQQLAAEEREEIAALGLPAWWRRLLPTREARRRWRMRAWFRRARAIIAREITLLRRLPDESGLWRQRMVQLLNDYDFRLESLRRHLQQLDARLEQRRQQAEQQGASTAREIEQERGHLIQAFNARVLALHEEFGKQLQGWNGALKNAYEEMRQQGLPLNVDLPPAAAVEP